MVKQEGKVGIDGTYPVADSPYTSQTGAVASSPTGNSLKVGKPDESESSAFQTGAKGQIQAIGNSGTQVFGGYFSEEYLQTLRGRTGAKKWDEMRRSESQVSMLLAAIMNPIKSANWDIEPFDEVTDDFEKHADLCKTALFDMIDFDTFKHEALTMIPFGYSLFEVVHSVEFNHPKFGTFNGLKALGFRSQKTIENWQLEKKTGKLLGVNQFTYSDLGGNNFIPGEFIIVFTLNKEGDNYEGISALRPMLGAYSRKDLYLKLAAIGVEKYAFGTVIGTVPKGKERGVEYEAFKKTLQNYMAHECAYITKPEGWGIDIQKGDFDASKIKELLTFENTEFANAVVGNFLALGMNGAGSSLALGSNLLEFFTTGIQSYADLLCSVLNRTIIPNLVKLNFGDQPGYPRIKVTGITDKAGKELAETIKFLADGRALDPDQPFKEHVRKQYKFPKPDPATAVTLPLIPAGGAANYPKPGGEAVNPVTDKVEASPAQLMERVQSMQLADKKYVAKFDGHKSALKAVMQTQLRDMYAGLKDKLRTRYNGLSGSDKILAAKGLSTPGLQAYKSVLRESLSSVAADSLAQARRLVPSKKGVKLAEGAYPGLPSYLRNLVNIQANLIAETQASDIEKQVFFQFTTSATKSDDINAILHDVDTTVNASIDGSTGEGMSVDAAAGDGVAHVTQQAAMSFFMDPEVSADIESMTFTNEDPVSECCQELAGTTFAMTDPDLARYQPPLHHNCKSRYVPNLKDDNGNPEIDTDGVGLSAKALKAITL